MKKWQIYLIAVLTVLLVGIGSGWKLHKTLRPCPAIVHDTTYVWDTVVHTIIDHVPYYIQHLDTIIVQDTIIQPVDTSEILKDYFAIHIYDREWKDTLLQVNMKDYISQNKSIHNEFKYKILRPQQVIINTEDNRIYYDKYIQLGIGVPIQNFQENIKYAQVEANYVFPKGYVGAYYEPQIKSFGAKAGITVLKFRKLKK